jgi:ATP-dependent DNA ligase
MPARLLRDPQGGSFFDFFSIFLFSIEARRGRDALRSIYGGFYDDDTFPSMGNPSPGFDRRFRRRLSQRLFHRSGSTEGDGDYGDRFHHTGFSWMQDGKFQGNKF